MSVGKLIRKGLPFSNVVATGTATAPITPGRTLERITLELGGTSLTKAMLTGIRLKANGKVFMDASGSQMDTLMKYRSVANDPAFLSLDFTETHAKLPDGALVGAFDTSKGVANITAEVDIAGANAPTLSMILTESASQAAQGKPFAGAMHKLLRYPWSVAVGGQLAVSVPFGPVNGAVIKRLHIFGANVTGLTVKQDSNVIHESTAAENAFRQKEFGMTPQAGCYTADFILEGDITTALDTRDAKTLEWLITTSAADNGYILVEYLDVLGNL